MEDAIAKPARDTSMETLHAMFGQLMASVTGSFGDREAAALKHRSDTAIDRICRRLCELEAHQLFAYCEGAPLPTYWADLARPTITGERAQIAWGHLAYLDRHRGYLRYASCRRRGLSIGSGVTEGACKSVIAMRFKRSGQRWFEEGLSPCLQLRALHLNERLRPCFDLLVAARSASLAAA